MATSGISCRPDGAGFWYRVSGLSNAKFWFNYFAVGSSGHQTVGEVVGQVSSREEWQFWPVFFEVMHVGVTEFDIESGAAGGTARRASQPLPPVDHKVLPEAWGGPARILYTSPYSPYS